jgi:hypothetical protein
VFSRFISRRFELAVTLSCTAFLVALAGCGSGTEQTGGTAGAAKLLKKEDLYKWQGKGKSKVQDPLDLHEKKKLRRQAAAKEESS